MEMLKDSSPVYMTPSTDFSILPRKMDWEELQGNTIKIEICDDLAEIVC